MKTKTKWKYQQHIDAGQQLSESRDELGPLIVSLSHSYSVNCKAIKLAIKAQHYLDALRCELDSQLARDYGSKLDNPLTYGQGSLFSTWVYYPHGSTPQQEAEMAEDVQKLAAEADASVSQ